MDRDFITSKHYEPVNHDQPSIHEKYAIIDNAFRKSANFIIHFPAARLTVLCTIMLTNKGGGKHQKTKTPSVYFATPLAFNAPDGGVPWDDVHKILH